MTRKPPRRPATHSDVGEATMYHRACDAWVRQYGGDSFKCTECLTRWKLSTVRAFSPEDIELRFYVNLEHEEEAEAAHLVWVETEKKRHLRLLKTADLAATPFEKVK